MREHMGLFRGKEKRTGKWIVGGLMVGVAHELWQNEGRAYIMIFPKYLSKPNLIEVDPDTVGECTGMRDKNGKLIFEGDIVESEFTKMPYLVCFGEYTYTNEYGEEECACGWYNKDSDDIVTGFGCPETWATVIGNVVDNPEQLEGGANHAAD